MNTYTKIDNTTQTAERLVRAIQGFCLLASLANCGPITLGGKRFTPADLSKLAFSGRIVILSLDLLKDFYCLTPIAGSDRSFQDLRDGHKVCTLNNIRDLSTLIVDLSTVSLLLTDTLGVIPTSRLTQILDKLCDPCLVTLFAILFRDAQGNHKIAKSSLDLIHVLAPYFLARWADQITPVTLVVTGLYGGYALWK